MLPRAARVCFRRLSMLTEILSVIIFHRGDADCFLLIACIVTYVLQSEPTVRLVLVASRLSQYLRQISDSNSPSLPMFTFWSNSLRTALGNDPFWGPDYFDDIEPRAQYLENGIQDLVAQCCTLQFVLESTPQTGYKSSSLVSKTNQKIAKEDSGMRLKPSGLAINQLYLIKEEENWMRRIILGCWTTLLADAAHQWHKGASFRRRPAAMIRVRSLTS